MPRSLRAKPVSFTDVQMFGKKCIDMGVREAVLVIVSSKQENIDEAALTRWANDFGIGLTLFYGWDDFVNQVLFWSSEPNQLPQVVLSISFTIVSSRLKRRRTAVSLWHLLTTTVIKA